MASQYFDYEHIDPTADVENHRRVLWACAVHTVVHTVIVHDMGSGCGYTDLMQINCLPLISSIAIWSHSLLVRGGVGRVGEICRGRKELREIFLLVVAVHLLFVAMTFIKFRTDCNRMPDSRTKLWWRSRSSRYSNEDKRHVEVKYTLHVYQILWQFKWIFQVT